MPRNKRFRVKFPDEWPSGSGERRPIMYQARKQRPIRVGIVGVGNCASALVQGIEFYKSSTSAATSSGLMMPEIGNYMPGDLMITAAFDVAASKVGLDISEAIRCKPNNTIEFASVPSLACPVHRGKTLDGIGKYLKEEIEESTRAECDVAAILKSTRTDVVVSYLPVGSQSASEFYAAQALEAGCAYVNCIPVFLASDPGWRKKFASRRLPLIGDDIKSQLGATIVHRVLVALMRDRGIRLDRTYQLNFGGNSDFKNMLERERLESKRISKTRSVQSQVGAEISPENIHIGPSDFVSWLADRKTALIRLESAGFGNTPVTLEIKLDVWDSPNSAGVVMDAIRCAKLALDRRIGGVIEGPAAYYMKSPPVQMSEGDARKSTLEFIEASGDEK